MCSEKGPQLNLSQEETRIFLLEQEKRTLGRALAIYAARAQAAQKRLAYIAAMAEWSAEKAHDWQVEEDKRHEPYSPLVAGAYHRCWHLLDDICTRLAAPEHKTRSDDGKTD